MRASGIVRKVDYVGRIVIPSHLRRNYNINVGDPMEIYQEGEYIIIGKYLPKCVFCGETESVDAVRDKFVCQVCKEAIINYKLL